MFKENKNKYSLSIIPMENIHMLEFEIWCNRQVTLLTDFT